MKKAGRSHARISAPSSKSTKASGTRDHGTKRSKAMPTSTSKGKAKSKAEVSEGETVAKKKKGALRGSAQFSAYMKSYKGLNDFHLPVFTAVQKFTSPAKVLYPGCHRHITASLIFQSVVYIDNYSKVKELYSDPKALEFVRENKEYSQEPEIVFKCKNFEGNFGENEKSFDLLMSLSAGIVSKPCGKYLKSGGYLFVSDAHFDARMAFVDPDFNLVGVYDDGLSDFDTSGKELSCHFISTKGVKMTNNMVQESIDKPKAKRSFKLQKEALFYLFQRK